MPPNAANMLASSSEICFLSLSGNSLDNRNEEKDWNLEVSTMRHTIPFAQKYKDLFIGVLALLVALALFELILAAPLI
jgi:hypothetical protein